MGIIEKLTPALPAGTIPGLKRVLLLCGAVCFIIGCANNGTYSKSSNFKKKNFTGNQGYSTPQEDKRSTESTRTVLFLWKTAWKSLTQPNNGEELLDWAITSPPFSRDFLSSSIQKKEKSRFDFPIILNGRVKRFVRYYHGRNKVDFARRLARSSQYLPTMKKLFKEQGIPEDLVYLAIVESGFHPLAQSQANAVGIWQFTKATGQHYGLRRSYWFDERRDPYKSTVAAATYLSDLYRDFGDWYLALAGYNTGTGAVERAIKRYGTRNFWKLSERKALCRQTRDYVPKIIAAIYLAKNAEHFGFDKAQNQPRFDFENIVLFGKVNLKKFSSWAGVCFKEVKRLNPELLGDYVYAPDNGYALHVPKETVHRFLNQHGCQLPGIKWQFVHYKARSEETLYNVASRFGTDPLIISQANDLPSLLRIAPKKDLLIPVPVGRNSALDALSALTENRYSSLAKNVATLADENILGNKDNISELETLFNLRKRTSSDTSQKILYEKISDKDIPSYKSPRFLSRLLPGSRYLYSFHPPFNS